MTCMLSLNIANNVHEEGTNNFGSTSGCVTNKVGFKSRIMELY